MKIDWLILQVFFLVKTIYCVEQTCIFETLNWSSNCLDHGPRKNYYTCKVTGTKLINENEMVNTNTLNSTRANGEVEMIYYDNNEVKFIPNSIFMTFVNLEYIYLAAGQKLDILKKKYLKNAKNLKVFFVNHNKITTLGPGVFMEAANLEHISLVENLIESVDVSTFHGLPKLQAIYLGRNRIKKMHWMTFTGLHNLKNLDLQDNVCVNRIFSIPVNSLEQIENVIRIKCEFGGLESNESGNSQGVISSIEEDAKIEALKKKLKEVNDKLELATKERENLQAEIKRFGENVSTILHILQSHNDTSF